MPYLASLTQSPGIGQFKDGDISDLWICGQSVKKENCHNSRTSEDIDMKLGPVTKIDRKNKNPSKKIDDMLCQQIMVSLSVF